MRIITFLSLLLISWGWKAVGQTYPSQNFPNNGDFFPFYNDTIPYFYQAHAVLGVPPWQFSQLAAHVLDTFHFKDPNTTALAGHFPMSTTAHWSPTAEELREEYTYLFWSNENLLIEGTSITPPSDSLFALQYTEPLSWIKFPVQIGSAQKDSAWSQIFATGAQSGVPADSILYKHTINVSDTVDQVGTLKVPGRIVSNAIRRIRTEVTRDSLFTKVNGIWSLDTEHNGYEQRTWVEWYHAEEAWLIARALITDSAHVQSFRYAVGPPATTRLEITGLPSNISEVDTIYNFDVSAYDINTGSLATNFNDSIFLTTHPDTLHGFGHVQISSLATQAVNGVASFQNISFWTPGEYRFVVKSDTAASDTSHIVNVHPAAKRLQASIQGASYLEMQTLDNITVSAITDMGHIDSLFYSENVYVGKLIGPGELIGTRTKPIVNGYASFDDLKLTHQGSYQLAFYTSPNQRYLIPDTLEVLVSANSGIWAEYYTDTISTYVDRANEFYWTGNTSGYLSGTSRGSFREIGQHFDFQGQARVTKVLIHFASRMLVGNHTDTFEIKVYGAGLAETNYTNHPHLSFMDSLPITLLGSQYFAADSILYSDYWNQHPTTIEFDTPPTVHSSFIISLVTDSELSNDTIIVWTSIPGDGQQEFRTSRLDSLFNDTLETFNWIRDKYWRPSYDVDLMIAPVLEVDTLTAITRVNERNAPATANVFPNPSAQFFNVEVPTTVPQPRWMELYALDGSRVHTQLISSRKIRLDLTPFSSGEFILILRDGQGIALTQNRVTKTE